MQAKTHAYAAVCGEGRCGVSPRSATTYDSAHFFLPDVGRQPGCAARPSTGAQQQAGAPGQRAQGDSLQQAHSGRRSSGLRAGASDEQVEAPENSSACLRWRWRSPCTAAHMQGRWTMDRDEGTRTGSPCWRAGISGGSAAQRGKGALHGSRSFQGHASTTCRLATYVVCHIPA